MNKIKVLHISPDFNYSCGVSKYISILLEEFSTNENYELHFITNGGDRINEIENFNVHFKLIPFSKGIKNIFHLSSIKKELKKYIKTNEINIVHTHHRFPEYVATSLSKELNFKTVSTVHSITKGFKGISFRSDLLIAVSYAVKNHLTKIYQIDGSRIIVKYNPIKSEINPIDKIEAKSKHGLSENDFVFLFTGTVCKRKGFDLLLKAFKEVSLSYDNVKLIVVGNWEEFDKSDVSKNKNILCFEASKDINQFYSAADAVVLPSRVDPFPYVMLEAGLYVLPFIGSRTSGIQEFVDDKINGLLFENENVDELTACMKNIITLEDERTMYAHSLNVKVLKIIDIKRYCNELRNIYSDLLNEII